ncbi:MAG: AI-2E family transporter [Candidatus Latescibacteria bacterium]|jgi:predicted PurR-regulated permease PerM|nr:AI-2E family transporter [Candidatus Latescibacterota bacterium]
MEKDDGETGTPAAGAGTEEAARESRPWGGDRPFFRVAILVFLAVFLYVLRNELSPVLVGATLVVLLLLTRRGVRFEAGIGVVSVLLFLAWVLSELAGLLWPFVASFVLAYLLEPLIGILERRISRTLAIAILALLVLGGLFGIGILIVPVLIAEVGELVARLPGYGRALMGVYDWLLARVEAYGYTVPAGEIQQWVMDQLPEIGSSIATKITSALKGLTSGVAALLNLLMIPFVTYYVLKDYDRIKAVLVKCMPPRHTESTSELVRRVDHVLGQYIRGQIVVCGFIAALTALGLAILGIRYAVILGAMAGLLSLIPFVGVAISLVVASLITLLDADPLFGVGKVVVVFAAVQLIEGNFLSPKLLGSRVGLHPAWVMFALVFSAHFWGFLGMVIAIPAAAVVNILLKSLSGRYFSSRYYGPSPE